MLTTAGTGKYLTERWQRDRARALIDRSAFTADELTWLEIGTDGGIVSEHDPGNFKVPTQPIDPFTNSRTIDMRKHTGRS